jgi:hypothetical protein
MAIFDFISNSSSIAIGSCSHSPSTPDHPRTYTYINAGHWRRCICLDVEPFVWVGNAMGTGMGKETSKDRGIDEPAEPSGKQASCSPQLNLVSSTIPITLLIHSTLFPHIVYYSRLQRISISILSSLQPTRFWILALQCSQLHLIHRFFSLFPFSL